MCEHAHLLFLLFFLLLLFLLLSPSSPPPPPRFFFKMLYAFSPLKLLPRRSNKLVLIKFQILFFPFLLALPPKCISYSLTFSFTLTFKSIRIFRFLSPTVTETDLLGSHSGLQNMPWWANYLLKIYCSVAVPTAAKVVLMGKRLWWKRVEDILLLIAARVC